MSTWNKRNGFYNFLTILSYKLLFAACYGIWHELSFFCKKKISHCYLNYIYMYHIIFKLNVKYRTPCTWMITISKYHKRRILSSLYNFHIFFLLCQFFKVIENDWITINLDSRCAFYLYYTSISHCVMRKWLRRFLV